LAGLRSLVLPLRESRASIAPPLPCGCCEWCDCASPATLRRFAAFPSPDVLSAARVGPLAAECHIRRCVAVQPAWSEHAYECHRRHPTPRVHSRRRWACFDIERPPPSVYSEFLARAHNVVLVSRLNQAPHIYQGSPRGLARHTTTECIREGERGCHDGTWNNCDEWEWEWGVHVALNQNTPSSWWSWLNSAVALSFPNTDSRSSRLSESRSLPSSWSNSLHCASVSFLPVNLRRPRWRGK
jgi:hypothetical protein